MPLILKAMALVMVLLNPTKQYYQAGQDVTVRLDAQAITKLPEGLDTQPLKALLLSPSGAIMASAPLDRKQEALDLMALFSGKSNPMADLFDGRVRYVQLVAGETPVGTALVILPIRTPGRSSAGAVRVEPEQVGVFHTELGDITIRMDYEAAPNTCQTIARLIGDGFYKDTTFHRIVPGYLVQAGDPTGTSTGSPGFSIRFEPSDKRHTRGTVGLARYQDPNSGSSQFYICLGGEQLSSMDGKFTAFADVLTGIGVVEKIAAGQIKTKLPVGGGAPVTPVAIKSTELVLAPPRLIDPTAKPDLRPLPADVNVSSDEMVESLKMTTDAMRMMHKTSGAQSQPTDESGVLPHD